MFGEVVEWAVGEWQGRQRGRNLRKNKTYGARGHATPGHGHYRRVSKIGFDE